MKEEKETKLWTFHGLEQGRVEAFAGVVSCQGFVPARLPQLARARILLSTSMQLTSLPQ